MFTLITSFFNESVSRGIEKYLSDLCFENIMFPYELVEYFRCYDQVDYFQCNVLLLLS